MLRDATGKHPLERCCRMLNTRASGNLFSKQARGSLALLQVPVSAGQQVHVGVQEARVAVDAIRGRRVPVYGHLHILQILLCTAVAGVDLKGVPMVPAAA